MCGHCRAQLPNNAELEQHGITFRHKPFRCLCGEHFTRASSRKRHIEDKSKQPYPCDLCNSVFGRTDKLRAHYRNKHKVEEEKMGIVCEWMANSRARPWPGHQFQCAAPEGQRTLLTPVHDSFRPSNQLASPSISVSGTASADTSPGLCDDLGPGPVAASGQVLRANDLKFNGLN